MTDAVAFEASSPVITEMAAVRPATVDICLASWLGLVQFTVPAATAGPSMQCRQEPTRLITPRKNRNRER